MIEIKFKQILYFMNIQRASFQNKILTLFLKQLMLYKPVGHLIIQVGFEAGLPATNPGDNDKKIRKWEDDGTTIKDIAGMQETAFLSFSHSRA